MISKRMAIVPSCLFLTLLVVSGGKRARGQEQSVDSSIASLRADLSAGRR
jgi:hypothetical protein